MLGHLRHGKFYSGRFEHKTLEEWNGGGCAESHVYAKTWSQSRGGERLAKIVTGRCFMVAFPPDCTDLVTSSSSGLGWDHCSAVSRPFIVGRRQHSRVLFKDGRLVYHGKAAIFVFWSIAFVRSRSDRRQVQIITPPLT